MENGRVRIPPERYEDWAAAYGLAPYDFVKTLMSFYDPVTYRLLFQESSRSDERGDGIDGDFSMQTAVDPNHVRDRYVEALYLLLGKKTAELEMLQEKLDLIRSS